MVTLAEENKDKDDQLGGGDGVQSFSTGTGSASEVPFLFLMRDISARISNTVSDAKGA